MRLSDPMAADDEYLRAQRQDEMPGLAGPMLDVPFARFVANSTRMRPSGHAADSVAASITRPERTSVSVTERSE
jgi:hypothetical protein